MWPTDFETVDRSKLSNTEIMNSVPLLGRCMVVCVLYFVEHRGLPINRSSLRILGRYVAICVIVFLRTQRPSY
jgi:hypothetical protein